MNSAAFCPCFPQPEFALSFHCRKGGTSSVSLPVLLQSSVGWECPFYTELPMLRLVVVVVVGREGQEGEERNHIKREEAFPPAPSPLE